jgi:hypothetical protein
MLTNQLVLAPEEECLHVLHVDDMGQAKPSFMVVKRAFLLWKRVPEQ